MGPAASNGGGAHDFDFPKRQAIYRFLERAFDLTGIPVSEADNERIPERMKVEEIPTMLVFDDAHPRPPHAVKGRDAVAALLAASKKNG